MADDIQIMKMKEETHEYRENQEAVRALEAIETIIQLNEERKLEIEEEGMKKSFFYEIG